MNQNEALAAAYEIIRQKIGRTKCSEFPLNPQDIDPLLLTLLQNWQSVSLAVSAIARDEFELVTTSDGYIDLPQEVKSQPEPTLPTGYKAPTTVPVIPPMEGNRVSRRGKVMRDKGQE